MEDFVKRIADEQTELNEKSIKLEAFLASERYNDLDLEMQILLSRQMGVMKEYDNILLECIKLLTKQ